MTVKSTESAARVRVGLISLGCAKNLVDAEVMLGNLLREGLELTNEPTRADVVIVNTCSFIDAAQEESVDAILESAEVREAHHRGQALVVAGCLPQRFRDELPKLLPEVDVFMGIDQVTEVAKIVETALARRAQKLAFRRSVRRNKKAVIGKLAELDKQAPGPDALSGRGARSSAQSAKTETVLGATVPSASAAVDGPLLRVNLRPTYIPDYATPRFRLTPRHMAYVKIAEGCNHPCSFCIIPRIRGSHRSRLMSDILSEASALLADGVRELNLISQDSTYYGLDLRPNHRRTIASPQRFSEALREMTPRAASLPMLLRELNALPGQFWIRLLYTHPAHWSDELIQTIAQCPKVARYVDLPLQHIHDNMLERMRRETSRQYIVDLLRRIRAGIPGIALRTTFIVGFPGETEESFETLLEFIRETRFERLGVFTYSREEGTRAAAMAGQVPAAVKRRRRERAMAVQHDIAAQMATSFVGRTVPVLVEREANGADLKHARISSWEHGLSRGEEHEPLRLSGHYLVARSEADAPDIDGRVYIRGGLPLGEFGRVKVIGHTDYDLVAEPA